MNDHKIAFIICYNNETTLSECIHYLSHLEVPEGFETELLTIPDAPSMTAGYQEAMEASDAKYKVYLHQDVFILYRYFLSELLRIFRQSDRIGMIGMVGYQKVAPSGVMWKEKGFGGLYDSELAEKASAYKDYRYDPNREGMIYAALIDGFLMATQYDIPWDTEHLHGFDFYDAFQSMRFIDAGYRIAVPGQLCPWCLHDAGLFSNLLRYGEPREEFLRLYKDHLGKSAEELALLFPPHHGA